MDTGMVHDLLALSDLTDDGAGPHPINFVLKDLYKATAAYFPNAIVSIQRGSRIVSTAQEFDSLLIPNDHKLRTKAYGFYLSDDKLLRTHPTSLLPTWLQQFSKRNANQESCLMPAMCFVQTEATKSRIPTPHKLDIWHVKKDPGGQPYNKTDMMHFIQHLCGTIDKDMDLTFSHCSHPYTDSGISANLNKNGNSMKILEGGLIGKSLLEKCQLDPTVFYGFGIGLGMDRLVMLMKNIDDIRLLRTWEEPIPANKKSKLR